MENINPDLRNEKNHITADIDQIGEQVENRLRGLSKLQAQQG